MMASIEPVVRANVLSEWKRFTAPSTVDPAKLLAKVGLTEQDIEDPDRYISLNTVAELFELSARHTQDTNFGLNYAASFPEGGSGLLGHLMLTAPTVGAVLQVLEDYLEIHALPMRAKLEEHDGTFSFFLGFPPSFTAPHMQYAGFLLATLVLRLRLGAGPTWKPFAVDFAHREPADLQAYQRYFGVRLSFDAPRYRFDVAAEDMAKPMPESWKGLSDSVRRLAARVLIEERTRYDIVDRTKMVLAEMFESEQQVDLETTAKNLELSSRTLQWRLEQAGTSYERLLSRARRRLAVHLLRDTDLPMALIAGRLGYSETSAFTRAAQAWFKQTPTNMRKRLREGWSSED